MPSKDAKSNGEIYTENLTTTSLDMGKPSPLCSDSPKAQNDSILLENIQETPPDLNFYFYFCNIWSTPQPTPPTSGSTLSQFVSSQTIVLYLKVNCHGS